MADVELINPLLGMKPFVLVEFGEDIDGDLAVSLQYGGGISTHDEIRMALNAALDALEETEAAGLNGADA